MGKSSSLLKCRVFIFFQEKLVAFNSLVLQTISHERVFCVPISHSKLVLHSSSGVVSYLLEQLWPIKYLICCPRREAGD